MIAAHEAFTEVDALRALDQRVESSTAFRVHREVDGSLMQHLPWRETKERLRIDRILVPTPKLLEQGWSCGTIGVEGKRPGSPAGKAVAQAQDYQRCAFRLVTKLGRTAGTIVLERVFIYPFDPTEGCIGSTLRTGDFWSFMLQNRIGCAFFNRQDELCFLAERHLLTIASDGVYRELNAATSGQKVGSR